MFSTLSAKLKLSQAEYLVILSVLNGRLVQNNCLFVSKNSFSSYIFSPISVPTHKKEHSLITSMCCCIQRTLFCELDLISWVTVHKICFDLVLLRCATFVFCFFTSRYPSVLLFFSCHNSICYICSL